MVLIIFTGENKHCTERKTRLAGIKRSYIYHNTTCCGQLLWPLSGGLQIIWTLSGNLEIMWPSSGGLQIMWPSSGGLQIMWPSSGGL